MAFISQKSESYITKLDAGSHWRERPRTQSDGLTGSVNDERTFGIDKLGMADELWMTRNDNEIGAKMYCRFGSG
jgi:hypothetical protein